MSNPAIVPHAHTSHDAGYRHEALFYADADEFMAGTLQFLRDAVAAGEPTLVVLAPPKIQALGEALNGEADQVSFADMAEVGTNPARIIPAWQQFLVEHEGKGRRLRGIGEPIWAERSAAELAECQRHEALLNVCFDDPDFWLLCPYDTTALDPEVIEEARRNHPFLSGRGVPEVSTSFPGVEALAAPFDEPLPDPPGDAALMYVDRAALRGVREFVAFHAERAGLDAARINDLVLTADERRADPGQP